MKSIENTSLENLLLSKKYDTKVNNERLVISYRLFLPEDYDKDKKYPLVIFNHGLGESGSDNKSLLNRANDFFTNYFKEENLKKYKAIVLAPQCPNKYRMIANPIGNYIDTNEEEEVPYLIAIDRLIKLTIKKYNCDKERIYITGLSMGGYRSLSLSIRNKGFYAAVMPVCPAFTMPKNAASLENTNCWIFHGEIDNTVPIESTLKFKEALDYSNIPSKLTTYPNTYHNSWKKAYSEKDFFEFMFSSKRNEYNKFLK